VGPGWTIALDAATYAAGAALLAPMRLSPAVRAAGASFVSELREGWDEFRSRTWLWVIVVEFAFLNAAANTSFAVLGPTVAKRELGGAGSWGLILTGEAVGLVLGGVLALRFRPGRPLLAASGGILLLAPMFGVLWDTTMQEQVPPAVLSRVYSYDALGSFLLMPVGFAVVGPLSTLVGIRTTLFGVAVLVVACVAAVLTIREVRTLASGRQP